MPEVTYSQVLTSVFEATAQSLNSSEIFRVKRHEKYLELKFDVVASYGSTQVIVKFIEKTREAFIKHDLFLVYTAILINDPRYPEQHYGSFGKIVAGVIEHVKSK